jgi:type I restriction enzyme S subunit
MSSLSIPETEPHLPENWAWAKLGQVGTVAAGGTPSTKDKSNFDGDVPWVTPVDLSDFDEKFIRRGRRNLSEKGLQSSSAVLLPTGTVLFSSRAPIGYVAVAANPIATNQGFKNLIPDTGVILSEYLYYYLKANKQLAVSYASGTTFLEVSGSRFSQIPVPLPPLQEQHRIVAKVEELITQADAGIQSLQKVRAQLREHRNSVLKAAFEGRLTERWRKAHRLDIRPVALEQGQTTKPLDAENQVFQKELPDSWRWATVADIAESMKNGIYKTKSYYSGNGIACLRMYNIENGSIVWKNIKRMNLTAEEIREYQLLPGDILVNRVNSRELVGKAARFPDGLETCVFESKNIRLRTSRSGVDSKYVAFWFLIFGQQYFNRNAQQVVGMASVNQNQLGAMPVPLPSLAEQYAIANRIGHIFSVADETAALVVQSSSQAERLRQSIWKKAFRGELVPQDPQDEPARILLERAKTRKGQMVIEKTGKERHRVNCG